jgi:hypothetical protein
MDRLVFSNQVEAEGSPHPELLQRRARQARGHQERQATEVSQCQSSGTTQKGAHMSLFYIFSQILFSTYVISSINRTRLECLKKPSMDKTSRVSMAASWHWGGF